MDDRMADAMLRHEADGERIQELKTDLLDAHAEIDRLNDARGWDAEIEDRLTAERDAAVARAEAAEQAVQRVRDAFQRWSGGPDDEFEQAMRRALDAVQEGSRT